MFRTLYAMDTAFTYTIFSCGDHAVTVDFGNVIDENINRHVLQVFSLLKAKNIAGVKDVIPAYSSVTLVYDVVKVRSISKASSAFSYIQQQVETTLSKEMEVATDNGRLINIPACYEEPFAPDLPEMTREKNMSIDEIINLHTGKPYRVYMLGFLPGFPYMGSVEASISMPRRQTPRTKVPEGSIGIAGLQTGIYSVESPGGWNIIARTPLKLFDAAKQLPVLLQPGDHVQFYRIDINEFNHIKSLQ